MIQWKRVGGLALAAAICIGCTSDAAPPAAENDGGGACNVDYARLAGHRRVAFRADVIPILNLSCGLSTACHASSGHKAGLVLGDPCQGSGAGMCAPLDETAIDAIHANLLAASLTAPAVQRVAATKPAESFLLDKVADLQNGKGYACTPQDSSVQGCGTAMPPGGPEVTLCTRRGGQELFDVIAAWVLQGAPND